MELKGEHFVCLIVTIGVISGESLYYKLPKDHDPSKEVRGNSFGLENFLMQVYKEVDSANHGSILHEDGRVKENFIRQDTHSNRGQTYGLENLAPNLYEFNYEQKNSHVHQTDRESNIDLKQEKSEPQVPINHQQQISENKDRRERHKIRKVVKHTRRPVTVTEVSNNIKIHEEFQNEDFQENLKVADKERLLDDRVTQTAAASYEAPKIQDVQESEKETDKTISGQRPRKRITMRRRRKRPTQTKQNPERIILLNNTESINEVNETYEIKKEETVITPITTTLTTTIKSITEKVRVNRTRPIGFRKVNQTEEVYEPLGKVETTTEYHKSELNEGYESTTYLPEITENSDGSYVISTVDNARDVVSSTEETFSADFKTILKQQREPLSLSELLQTQNLSLADFLKNKKEAALFLSGKKGSIRITSPRSDVRERHRPLGQNFSSKSRPFSKNRQEEQVEETTLNERDNSPKHTTEKSNYNSFASKNPRNRYGHFKGVYPTIKSLSKSDSKTIGIQNTTKTTPKTEINLDTQTESLAPPTETSEVLNLTKNEQKSTTRRVNDLRQKFRIHRRKYNIFSTTTTKISKEENHESTTLMSTVINSNETSITYENVSTTEEIQTAKNIGIRIPFKSSNNPELSLILPSKNKTEEKMEKTEKPHDLFTRMHSFKKFHQENEVVKSNESNILKQAITTRSPNESTLPIHIIDMDDEKESNSTEKSKENSKTSPEEKKKILQSKRMEVVGKIPPPNEPYKYESRDEILELLKTGSNLEALKLILHARNMTIKELLENRGKSSLQSNFSKPFNDNDLNLQKRSEMKRTTLVDPDFKVFQSLPDFQPIHKNLLQKTVKELHSNSYPDSLVEESRILPMEVKVPAPIIELKGSKQLSNAIEIKKKHQFKTDSLEIFDKNDELNRWHTREKPIYYSNPFSIIRERSNPYTPPNQDKFSVLEKSDNELVESDIILLETIKKSQEASQKLKNNINEILQEQSEIKDLNKEIDKLFIPPAVKSAIIASGVVMGLALFVFIAIFAACGWKQRQVRLRAHSSILNDALAKSDSEKKIQNTKSNQLNSGNFKQSTIYKKSLEIDNESTSSASTSSNASSYLWSTLKNTFTGRNNMLKKRLGKEDKIREERRNGLNGVLKSQDNRRNEVLAEDKEEKFLNPLQKQEERYSVRNTEIHDCMKRSSSFKTSNHFNSWTHGQ